MQISIRRVVVRLGMESPGPKFSNELPAGPISWTKPLDSMAYATPIMHYPSLVIHTYTGNRYYEDDDNRLLVADILASLISYDFTISMSILSELCINSLNTLLVDLLGYWFTSYPQETMPDVLATVGYAPARITFR